MSIRNLSNTTKNILILICFIVVAILIYCLRHIIAPFLVALVIAYIINPTVRWLTERKFYKGKSMSRGVAVSVVFLVAICLGIIFVVPFVGSMVSQAKEMGSKLENLSKTSLNERYKNYEKSIKEKMNEWFPDYKENWTDIFHNSKFQEYLAEGVVVAKDGLIEAPGKIWGFLGNTFSGVFNFFFIPMLVFYILLDMDDIFESGKKLIPPDYRKRTIEILNKIDKQLGAMLRGQCIENTIFAILMTIGFAMSGLKAALFLGPISGVANFIPYLGGFFSFILAFFAAITQLEAGAWLWLGIIATVAIVQFIDCWYMQPYIVGENAGLHPLTIMLALTVAGSLAGIVGMLLAVPVAIVIKVLGSELYHELYDQEPIKNESEC